MQTDRSCEKGPHFTSYKLVVFFFKGRILRNIPWESPFILLCQYTQKTTVRLYTTSHLYQTLYKRSGIVFIIVLTDT